MRVFATKAFARFARKEGVENGALCDAVDRAVRGLVDADLGGGVIKQRVARPGDGRSGGFRTLIAFRFERRAVFMFGFAKKDSDNIDQDELRALRKAAVEMLGWGDEGADEMVVAGKWLEVICA